MLVGTRQRYRHDSKFLPESYQSDGRTSSVAAEAAYGQRVTTTKRHLREPDTGRWPARDGGALNGSQPCKSRHWRRRSREHFSLQRARRFTNRSPETGNVNAKPRRIQPRDSENSIVDTKDQIWDPCLGPKLDPLRTVFLAPTYKHF